MPKPGFRHFVGVDFSGAKSPSFQRKAIWLCRGVGLTWEGTKVLTISELRCGLTRRELFKLIGDLEPDRDQGVLVGLDFPFSFPRGFPEGIGGDWAEVAAHLAASSPEEFISANAPPFYGNLRRAVLTRRDDRFFAEARFEELRKTETLAQGAESVFKLVGPRQVGKGALRGIPYLAKFAKERPQTHVIWPFSGQTAGPRVVVVEIFPRVFMGRVKKSVVQARLELLNNLRTDNVIIPGHVREAALAFPDALDALMGAVGLWYEETQKDRLASYDTSMYNDPAVRREGWIYGVDYP